MCAKHPMLEHYSNQITSFLEQVVLVTTGQKVITQKVQNWLKKRTCLTVLSKSKNCEPKFSKIFVKIFVFVAKTVMDCFSHLVCSKSDFLFVLLDWTLYVKKLNKQTAHKDSKFAILWEEVCFISGVVCNDLPVFV